MDFGFQYKTSNRRSWRGALAGAVALSSLAAVPAMAEERSYVISWLTQGTYSEDGDCAEGVEVGPNEQYAKILVNQYKKTPEEASKLMEGFDAGTSCGLGSNCELNSQFIYRGQVNGKPVTVYENPTSVPDPGLNRVTGTKAVGFNLDGKTDTGGFENPFTGEKGIDNEYFRATGCIATSRAKPPFHNSQWEYHWGAQRPGMRAWMVQIEGENLSADGDVTVRIFKALNPVRFDAKDEVMRNMTFQKDPDPRSQNTFKGRIKGNVLEIDTGRLKMIGNPYIIPVWDVNNFKARLEMKPDGTLDGYIGGYQNWLMLYYSYAQGAFPYEAQVGTPMVGLYYNFKKLADADPDPKTGQNMSISIAFRLEAVPAIVVPPPSPQVAEAK
jgi:hypothetical protein